MRKVYCHIPVDGPITVFEVEQGDELHELQRRVGGWITSVGRLIDGHTMYVDDEGMLKGYPPNVRASKLARQALCGDAVLVGLTDSEGETGSVTPAMRERLGVPVLPEYQA